MNTRTMLPHKTRPTNESLVWIDHEHAVIVSAERDGTDTVELLERDSDEAATCFEARIVDEVADEERVVVSGPSFARTSFERAFVAVTHRPDRLVDAEPRIVAGRTPAKAVV